MLQEALEVFENMLLKNEKLIIDFYSVKDGTYRLIEMNDDNWVIKNTLDIFYDKKTKEVIGCNNEDYNYIKELDYYSKLVEMNKPIDPKKIIHTNNYLSIAVKKESLVLKKLTSQVINDYFDILKNPIAKYDKKLNSRKLYESIEEQLGQIDLELLEKIENYILNNNIFDGINLDKKNYIKVFFVFKDYEKTRDYYKKEGERYLIPNLYNSNDYNFDDDGIILGLPNNNMGMNSKKPFLENKTRKIKVPYLLDQKKALLQSKFFDYLLGEVSRGKYNFYIDMYEDDEIIKGYTDLQEPNSMMSGYYLRCRKEKNEVEIIHADSITAYSSTLNPSFILKNYVGISQEKVDQSKLNYNVFIDNLWQVKSLIDGFFFEGKLQFNLYSRVDDIQINDGVLKRCILENRNALATWFYQGKTNHLESIVDKFTMDLIKNTLRHSDMSKAQRQLNLRWSLLIYFNDKRRIGENMVTVRDDLRKHINLPVSDEWNFEDDKEFAYAVGQIASYFVSLNKANNKPDAFINTFLNAKNVKVVKRKIEVVYKKYNYLIQHSDGSRFSQLITHIMIYEPQKLDTEYVIAGFAAPILIFEKNQEEKGNE